MTDSGTFSVGFRISRESRQMSQFKHGGWRSACPAAVRTNLPVGLQLLDHAAWHFHRRTESSCRRNAKRARYLAPVNQTANAFRADRPASGKLADRERFRIRFPPRGHLSRFLQPSLHSKESPFDLIAVDGPLGVGDFFSTVEFEIRAGADVFDELADSVWLAAVDGAAFEDPASLCAVIERQ